MVSVAEYLYRRGRNYYFLIKIPTDLKAHFGGRQHLVKSLKTSSLSEAKAAVEPLRGKTKTAFILMRSGILTPEQMEIALSHLQEKKKPQAQEKMLSDAIRMYLEEKKPNLKKRTLRDYETIFAKNVAIIGDRDINAVTREDVVRLRSTLMAEGVSQRTCNTHIVHLSSMFKWAVRLTLCPINCAEGLILTLTGRHDSERKRFDTKDLQMIFATIPLKDGDECNVWIPLIALYSGMRKEEICQLQRADIRQEEGVWVFDINCKGEKTTKTEAGLRLVPIHSVLIQIGFLEFCRVRAKGRDTGNLWGFIQWRESWGKKWGGQFNHWFATNIQTEKGKVFHSFRHTVVDELKQLGEPKELVSELIGHVVNDMTFGRYGKGYSVHVLRKAIERLSYDIDLSRINTFIAKCHERSL
ncbi:site-specific integrase [Geomonas terrae]|nr:site-specific integrase [Geomonas terrae]